MIGRLHQGITSVSTILDAAADNRAIYTFADPATVSLPTTVINSSLRTAFDTSMRQFVLRHQTEAVTRYPELRGYLRAA